MLLTGVCPVLLSVHVRVAAVGAVVGELLVHPVNDSTAGVLTVRLTATLAALPVLGVAVSVPL
jgi:sorbitol-specific phosphotransferase system component IIC